MPTPRAAKRPTQTRAPHGAWKDTQPARPQTYTRLGQARRGRGAKVAPALTVDVHTPGQDVVHETVFLEIERDWTNYVFPG
jgi:hypothetical protein